MSLLFIVGAALVGLVLAASACEPASDARMPAPLQPLEVAGVRSAPVAAPPAAATAAVSPAAGPATLDATSVEVLKAALASDDFNARLIAVEALGDLRSPAFVEWLGHALGDPEHDVRIAAVEALRQVGGPRARQLLRSIRDDTTEDLDIRALAASALLVR